MERSNQSKVWAHFDQDDDEATCHHCSKKLCCKGGSTSGLSRHLKNKHSLSLDSEEQPCSKKKAKFQQKSIMSFVSVEKESLQSIVSQLAAVDGFSIHAICKSKFIRESLCSKGFRLPLAESSIMGLIHCQNKIIQKEIRSKIEMKLQCNTRFSVTLDEYTSVRCRRYMNVNIHYQNEHINLGLIRMLGSCNAEKILQLLEKHLADVGIINMQTSIVSIVSDGASVMKKLGTISKVDHQLCYAHGLHLAVCDILYKSRSVAYAAVEDDNDEDGQDEENFDESLTTATPTTKETPVFNLEIEDVLKKVRKLVKVFRKSAVKNEVLQKYVVLEQKKELSLILDCKTRWSSMFAMIERFLLLKKCIIKALLDLSIAHNISETEFLFLDRLKCALEPVKLAVEALCRQDATLLSAEGIFRFLIVEIQKRRSTLANDLLCAIKNRIQQRRQHDLVNLMRYLQNPNTLTEHDDYDDDDDVPLSNNTKQGFLKTATSLVSRLFGDNDSNEAEGQSEEGQIELTNTNPKNDSLFERLQAQIEHSTHIQSNISSFDNGNRAIIKQEMRLLEATGKRPSKLEHIYNALLSIPPTSVEAERAFSAAGLFTTKIRSRLSDKSINALSFLRSYYMKNE